MIVAQAAQAQDGPRQATAPAGDLYQFGLPAGMNVVRTRTVNSNVFIVVVTCRSLDASNCPRSRTKNRFHE